jgi:hypothetical protein
MSQASLWQFPREADRIYEEACRFRQLSSNERFLRIVDLIGAGEALLASSPRRDAARRLREQDEEDWRRTLRELFARHAATTPAASAGPHDGPA